jgi:mono/diheme cytochrome c family protein
MRARALLPVLTMALVVGSLAAQEKQGAKPSPSTVQSPHAYNITPEEKDRKNPVRFTDASVERGKKIFTSQCAACHGEKGDGKGELAAEMKIQPADLTKPDTLSKRTDGELFAIIGTGSEKMPGQGTRMQDRQKWQVINYLRSLEGKTPAKATQQERDEEQNIQSFPQ